jgi:hypothetical protein
MPIDGKPTFHVGLAFCCAGCAVSGPCTCSYDDRPSAADVAAASRACGCVDDAGMHDSDAPEQVQDPAEGRHWLAEPIPVLSRR